MIDSQKIQEIESIGEEDVIIEEEQSPPDSTGTAVPLVQAAVCALILLALVILKFVQPQRYAVITDFYRTEMSQEIELPEWRPDQSSEKSEVSQSPPSETSLKKI